MYLFLCNYLILRSTKMAQAPSDLLAGIAPGTRICAGTNGEHQFVITPDEIRICDLQGELLHKLKNRGQNVNSWYQINGGKLLDVCMYDVIDLHTGKTNRYSLPHGLEFAYVTSCGQIICSRSGIYDDPQWCGLDIGSMHYISIPKLMLNDYKIAHLLPTKQV